MYLFFFHQNSHFDLKSDWKSSWTGPSAGFGLNNSLSLRVKRSDAAHSVSRSASLNWQASQPLHHIWHLNQPLLLMHEWQAASVFWPTPDRSRPQDTHTSNRHVPLFHWSRGNKKYIPPTTYSTLKLVLLPIHTVCKRSCKYSIYYCMYSFSFILRHLKENTY